MRPVIHCSGLLALATIGAALGAAVHADPADRQAYYGDLHLHTSYSFDAYVLFGAKVDPDAAYRFARGESVDFLGGTAKRNEPLDFLAVTDHSENIGVFNSLDDPNSEFSKSEVGKAFKANPVKTFFDSILSGTFASGKLLAGVNNAKELSQSAWQREIEAANRNYRPGTFTTFIAYEWSSMPDGQNLHRNVIFRGDKAPNPFSSVDSPKPEDLWNWLDKIRKDGYEALAIPHNSNASNGLMFDWNDSNGRPIDQAYAEQRASDEPLVEIAQNKGASETHPILSPNDEFSNFEFYDHLLISQKKSKPEGSYVRDALGRGLEISQRTAGVNPYKYGIIGASDFHNGLSTSSEEAFVGTFGGIDPTRPLPSTNDFFKNYGEARKIVAANLYETSSGNLTGVWAERNTREAIYDAFRRKETFATSGTRLKVRFFGGWDFPSAITKEAQWVNRAYAKGVPMGGDLPVKPSSVAAPRFIAWGVKDPNGANLDRLQVIKIWLQDGKHVERIYELALSNGRKVDPRSGKAPAVGSTVDLKTAAYHNSIGATQLSAVWQDPHFDPSVAAAYYLRVLEIPTPRWSTIVSVKRGEPLPADVPATIQERAWSSPIWYVPGKTSQRLAYAVR
ncbi:MAG: DUF3604 domain-containing protein [Steroidobacteraceae bacterium]|jgi:hypothetical protein